MDKSEEADLKNEILDMQSPITSRKEIKPDLDK